MLGWNPGVNPAGPDPEKAGTDAITEVDKFPRKALGPTSFDTSAVWPRVRLNETSTDPAFVASGAIPWPLLDAVGTQRGPALGDRLAH